MQSIWTKQNHYVFSQIFAIPDLFGRGYTRTSSFAYVTRVPKKLMVVLKTLRRVFTKAALDLKQEGQKIFLSKIDSCLDWVEYEISKLGKTGNLSYGQQMVCGRRLPASEHKDGIDLEIWKKYFDIELNRKTLKEIMEDMLVIREEFKKPIRELQYIMSSARSPMVQWKVHRLHHRPQSSKRVFHSIMKVLDEFSIERMNSQMEQMLAHCRGSALDIAIERKIRKRAESKDLVFNIGSLCKIPIGISKYAPPRKKYCSTYQPMLKLQNSLKSNTPSYAKTGRDTYSPESDSLPDLGDRSIVDTLVDEQKPEITVSKDDSESTKISGQTQSSWITSTLQLLISAPWSNSSNQEKKSSSINHSSDLLTIPNDYEQLSLDSETHATMAKCSHEVDKKSAMSTREFRDISHQNPNLMKGKMVIDDGNTTYQLNQSSADSSMSSFSFASRLHATRMPFRGSQLNLDNLLTKFLFVECERFAEEIIYTIFIGRPLLLIWSNHNYKHVRRYAQALSMLVPGANNLSVQLERNWPLTVWELPDLKIVVISKGAFSLTCKSVRRWCSYFILDELKLYALPYKRRRSFLWITRLLRKSSCKSSGQFRRHLQTNIARMQLRAYLYYWIFIIGVVKAPSDATDWFKGPFLGIEKMLKLDRVASLRENEGISDERDFAILQYWARHIQRQVVQASSYFGSNCFPPSREDEQDLQNCNISLRDRLLRQHSVTPTALLVSSERPKKLIS